MSEYFSSRTVSGHNRANAAQVLGCLNYSSCSPVVRAKDIRLLGLVIRTIKNLNIWEVQHMHAMHKKTA